VLTRGCRRRSLSPLSPIRGARNPHRIGSAVPRIYEKADGSLMTTLDMLEARAPSWLPREPGVPPEGLDACLSDVGVAVIETDSAGLVVNLNAAAERLTGWSLEEKHGAPLADVFRLASPESAGPDATLARELGVVPPRHSALLERRDGQVIPVRHVVGVAPLRPRSSISDAPLGQLVVFRDVNAEYLLTLKLTQKARYDSLTGLLQRSAIAERVELALAESRRTNTRHALCYFDLDRFRLVNSTCGHEAGDDLLNWVATRVHEFVGPNDAAGRIGGDEFALLLVDCDEREAERIVRDLQRQLLQFRFGWEEKTFSVGASFGLVFFGAENFKRAADVLSAADHACRMAKDNGRGRVQVYLEGEEMARSHRSMRWVAGIQRHIEEGRLRLYAQGIHPLGLRDNSGAHFEVLVRLVGDDGQVNSPVGIIQAAEQSGLMDAIDRFVLRQAFRTIGALPQKALRKLNTCSINLSGISLMREGLLDFIVSELEGSNVPPSKICFEITETAALANLGEVLWFMQELGAMGCRFAIDDFGSGHASYGYIESLPVDYVKIDGLFIRDLLDNALHRAIVESVQRIACTLRVKTVAEQVETSPVADMLTSMGVHYGQGWLFGRPQPIGELCAGLDQSTE
jgi:diguanylate cyclase (GGDEF)-like protein/PAS domain S-box-containing protein